MCVRLEFVSKRRAHDQLDYLSVGYIWVCNFVGFLIAGLANVFIVDRFGFGMVSHSRLGRRILDQAWLSLTSGCTLCRFRPSYRLRTHDYRRPLPALPHRVHPQRLRHGLSGEWHGKRPAALARYLDKRYDHLIDIQDALVSGLTARLPNATTRTFLNYASYSFGAMTSPLVATHFVKSARSNTFFYYAVSLSFGMVNVISLLSIFHLRTAEQILGRDRIQCSPTHVTAVLPAPDGEKQSSTLADHEAPMREADTETPPIRGEHREVACNSATKMRKMFSSPLLHCLAFYSALYVGGEFTIGGWVVSFPYDPMRAVKLMRQATFLQQERGGGVDMGYVVTGHFAGE